TSTAPHHAHTSSPPTTWHCHPPTATPPPPLHDAHPIYANNAPVGITTTAGTTVHDRATVSGTGPTPTGTVNFTFYTSLDCSTGGVTQSNIASTDGRTPVTARGRLATAACSIKAHYTCYTCYGPTHSLCVPLEATALTPIDTPALHDALPTSVGITTTAGTTVHDRATVSGTGPTPTGTVNFTFYTSLDCSTGGVTQS